MTRFARAKGSKASNERKEEEATPWHVMKQQFINLHNTTLQSNENCTSELKNLLQCDNTAGKEIWSDFGDINGNKVKTIKKKKIKEKCNNNHVKFKKEIDYSQRETHNSESLQNKSKKCKSLNVQCKESGFTNNLESSPVGKCPKLILKNKVENDVKSREHGNIGKEEISNGTAINLQDPKIKKFKSEKKLKNNLIEPDAIPVSKCKDNLKSKNKNKDLNKAKKITTAKPKEEKSLKNKSIENYTQNKCANKSISKKIKTKKGTLKKYEKADVNQSNESLKAAGKVCDSEDQTPLSTVNEIKDKQVTINSSEDKNSFSKNNKTQPTNYNTWKNFNNLHTIIANGREIKVVNFEGFLIKQDDAIELKRLRKKLRAQNIAKDKINAILKLERRKAEKSLAREKKSVCFHCRKFGHNFTDCPDIKDSDLSKSGMCFKCGSMEHSHYECKVLQSQSFRYAVCFVCKEQGHIARQCKMNPHGQYPKGGSCHLCGEITHLRKDCPKAENEKPTNVLTIEKLSENSIEDINTVEESKPKPAKKRKIKHVTF